MMTITSLSGCLPTASSFASLSGSRTCCRSGQQPDPGSDDDHFPLNRLSEKSAQRAQSLVDVAGEPDSCNLSTSSVVMLSKDLPRTIFPANRVEGIPANPAAYRRMFLLICRSVPRTFRDQLTPSAAVHLSPRQGESRMKITELLLAELDREAVRIRKTLEQVPEGKNDWKPHEKSMALGALATIVATIPAWLDMG